jgi:hypothetical protein
MMNMNETIEDRINSMYPAMTKKDIGSIKNMLGTPRQSVKKLGQNSNYRKMGKSSQ